MSTTSAVTARIPGLRRLFNRSTYRESLRLNVLAARASAAEVARQSEALRAATAELARQTEALHAMTVRANAAVTAFRLEREQAEAAEQGDPVGAEQAG